MFCNTFCIFAFFLYCCISRYVICVFLYLQHPLINAAVQPPPLIFVPVLRLLLPPFYSFRDEVVHFEPCLPLLHTCLALCFSVSVFVFAINIDQCFSHFVCFPRSEKWAQICVFQYLSAADICRNSSADIYWAVGKQLARRKVNAPFKFKSGFGRIRLGWGTQMLPRNC